MPRRTDWNTNAEYYTELELHNGTVHDTDSDPNFDNPSPALQPIAPYLQKLGKWAELIIQFSSKGYNDPGSKYGGRDQLGSPPEGDDERLPTNIYLKGQHGDKINLDQKLTQAIFDHYETEIYDTELPESDPGDEPEWDEHRDRYESIDQLANIITEDPNITH